MEPSPFSKILTREFYNEDEPQPKFTSYVSLEENCYYERNLTLRKLGYQLQKWEKVLEDFNGKKWKKTVVIRRLDTSLTGQGGTWYKVQDVFEDGKNVFHKETSPLDDTTLANLKKFWVKNFDKYYQNHPNEIKY